MFTREQNLLIRTSRSDLLVLKASHKPTHGSTRSADEFQSDAGRGMSEGRMHGKGSTKLNEASPLQDQATSTKPSHGC